MSSATTLLLTRTPRVAYVRKSLFISIDGKFVADLAHGDSVTVTIVPGVHVVKSRLSGTWLRSKPLKIHAPRSGKRFIDFTIPGALQGYRKLVLPGSAIVTNVHPDLLVDEAA